MSTANWRKRCHDAPHSTWQAFRNKHAQSDTHHAMSAGVLPFAINSVGELVFLLGRERVRRGRTMVWCDFGGGVSPNVHSIVGAAREFAEETIGIVVGNVNNGATLDFVSERVCPDQPIRSMFGSSVPYDMYLVEIPYDRDLPAKFLERRRIAEHHTAQVELASVLPSRIFHKSGRLRDAFLEKDSLRWITWHELLACTSYANYRFPLRREFGATIHLFATRIISAVSSRLCENKYPAETNAAVAEPHDHAPAAALGAQ